MLASRHAALLFRIASAILIGWGIVRITDAFGEAPSWGALLFYTVQSNLLCFVWMILLAVATLRGLRTDGARGFSAPWPRMSAAVMMAITVTMLVYLVVLVPSSFVQEGSYTPFSLTDNLVHIICPCLIILDWLLFVPRGRLRLYDPLLWAILPLSYLVFALLYGGLGGVFSTGESFPYPFLDIESYGVWGVALRVSVLTVTLTSFGYIYVGIDRLLGRVLGRTVRRGQG